MAREILDITGQVFGKLKVKDRVEMVKMVKFVGSVNVIVEMKLL